MQQEFIDYGTPSRAENRNRNPQSEKVASHSCQTDFESRQPSSDSFVNAALNFRSRESHWREKVMGFKVSRQVEAVTEGKNQENPSLISMAEAAIASSHNSSQYWFGESSFQVGTADIKVEAILNFANDSNCSTIQVWVTSPQGIASLQRGECGAYDFVESSPVIDTITYNESSLAPFVSALIFPLPAAEMTGSFMYYQSDSDVEPSVESWKTDNGFKWQSIDGDAVAQKTAAFRKQESDADLNLSVGNRSPASN